MMRLTVYFTALCILVLIIGCTAKPARQDREGGSDSRSDGASAISAQESEEGTASFPDGASAKLAQEDVEEGMASFPDGAASAQSAMLDREYGVFLGLDAAQADRMREYRLAVVEPSAFSAEQLGELHDAGKTVYAYLNMGAVEEYRPYYDRFQELTLDVYEDWPDERWIDVSSPAWQEFLVDELGSRYAAMGFDGFFLDNADVYYHSPEEDIFQGLCTILRGLKTYHVPLILNGGDCFVSRCMEEGRALSLFDGINQETVFTSIHFDSKTYGAQAEDTTAYYQQYLARAKECGLSVYLLEYGADRALAEKIDAYCRENGFHWYLAEGLELQ